MKRLLWKELRERWVWLLALVASTSGTIVMGDPYTFHGNTTSSWIFLSLIGALIFGASAHSSELGGGAAGFVRSRPVAWCKLLLAKLTIGAAIIVATSVIAAVVFRFTCPDQYLRFAGIVQLAEGALGAVQIMGVAYLIGFSCSLAGRGAAGGVLVVFIIIFSCMMEGIIYDQTKASVQSVWSYYFRFLGAGVATVALSRFGLTLPANWRLARFLGIVGVFAVIGLPINFLTSYDPLMGNSRADNSYSLSPDGRYAAVEQAQFSQRNGKGSSHSNCLVRLSDGKKARTLWYRSAVRSGNSWWHGDAFVVENAGVSVSSMDASGRLQSRNIDISNVSRWDQRLIVSPDGRWVMIAVPASRGSFQLAFADIDRSRALDNPVVSNVTDYWWKSENEVGYMDRNGERHVIRVAD